MKYQEWLNGCGCCPDIQDCPPSTGNPCDCDSILLELSKQHTDDLVLQDEIDNLDEKKLDASAYTPDEYATEEWVNEQGFLKTVEPLKTINGESLIGEGDIVISGGSGDAYTKAETDALLDEKQNVLNAGDYITIDSANTISTSGLVTVEDNEVPQFIAQGDMLTRYYPASGTPETVFANMPVKMKVRTSGWEPQSIDDIIYINDENGFVASGNCASRNQGVLTPSIPSELQPYLTVRFISGFYEGLNNLFEAKEGYRISYVDATMTDGRGQFEPGITPYFVAYEGGQSADVIKDVIEPELLKKQNTLIAGDYITIDSANIVSTSGLVTVEDNEVEEYIALTSDINDPSNANFNVTSYDDAADVFELIITGPTWEYFDVSNSRFVFINESGETTANIDGIYMFSTSGAVYPTRIQEYVNLDLYEYHTTDRYNVHLKYYCKNGWRLKQFFLYLATDYNAGVEFKTYQNYPALQSADAISENVYPALEKLTANKFDKNFTCNDPLLYEAAYKKFRIKTSNQNYDTISASTSATTNLARAYDVKTYVSGFTYDKDTIDNKIASGGTFDPTLYYKKSETSGKTEIQNALGLKLDASAFTESDYYKKSETSGKTELDAEFALYYKKSETSSKTEIDDALDNYYEKSETSGKTELSNEFALYYKKSETSGKTELDAAFSAITKTIDDNEQAVSEALNDLDDNKQDKLTAGTGIDITNNVISVTGGGESSGITSGEVQTMIDESISGKTNNSDFSAHTANTAIHLTSGDIQTQIDNSISGKADSADVYTKAETSGKTELNAEFAKYYKKTETYTKTEVDNKFWCGTEAQWAQISGSTENGILYLIY